MITQPTQEQKDYAKELARKVVQKMEINGWVDNPFNAAGNRFYADYIGFLGETVFADEYSLPRPQFTTEYKDGYDFLIKDLKCDLKTANEGKPICLSVERYKKVKGKTQAYIFSELYGPYYRVIGWCTYEELPFFSKQKLFTNGILNFVIQKSKLKDIKELIK